MLERLGPLSAPSPCSMGARKGKGEGRDEASPRQAISRGDRHSFGGVAVPAMPGGP